MPSAGVQADEPTAEVNVQPSPKFIPTLDNGKYQEWWQAVHDFELTLLAKHQVRTFEGVARKLQPQLQHQYHQVLQSFNYHYSLDPSSDNEITNLSLKLTQLIIPMLFLEDGVAHTDATLRSRVQLFSSFKWAQLLRDLIRFLKPKLTEKAKKNEST